jgi:membrane protease YdiL (CAAX protease family)
MPQVDSVASISAMTTDSLFLLLLIGAAVWVARAWTLDYRAALAGMPNERALPGATPASAGAVAIAALGALVILAAETGGEHVLGLSTGQSQVTALFSLYSILGAPVIEEAIFRGYMVIEHRGRVALWGGVVGASLLFALLHPLLWEWNGTSLTVHVGAKAWFSTAAIFMTSLWLYTVRFVRLNPQRSLLPCFVAHATKNLGVLAVKYVHGFVGGWW